MKHIFINESGPEVSAAVYGFWRWKPEDLSDPNQFNDVVLFTQELGITMYDHSPDYACGEAERRFGELIGNNALERDRLVLTTKTGTRYYSGANGSGQLADLSASSIVSGLESSLKRLQTDYIDILILERYDFLSDLEQTASTLLKLQRSGKVRYIGVGDFTVSQQELLSSYLSQPIITNHLEMNLLQTDALVNGKLDFIRAQHSRPLAFSPLADGRILLGEDAQSVKLRLALTAIGKKHEANVEQTAVAWLHRLGALPIIGSREKRRIQNAATAHTVQLSHEDWYYLYNASK